ncbi:MAG: hypothetical protein RL329_3232, partial [Bacteroidota bacterium]
MQTELAPAALNRAQIVQENADYT